MGGRDAIVIGAGAAGLAAAQALIGAGLSVRVLEKETRLAEPWRRRHKNLHLNTHRDLSTLPGVTFPDGTPSFPPRAAMATMMETFAAQHSLPIAYGAEVERVERAEGGWMVTSRGDVLRARHVVVATGRDAKPFTPPWPGMADYEGRIIHAADFGEASDYTDKSVMVVGAGNSGFDALNHLITARTGPIWLSARHAPAILPKRIMKIAVHQTSPLIAAMPARVGDWLLAATQRLVFGDLTRLGLPRARSGGVSRLDKDYVAIAADEGAIAAIKVGRVTVVPTVREFARDAVVLANGTALKPDFVIAATGYRTGLEPMLGHLGVLDGNGMPRFNADASDPALPGLWFIGMRPGILGDVGNARIHAKAIAARIATAR